MKISHFSDVPGKLRRFLTQTYAAYLVAAPPKIAQGAPPEGFTASKISPEHIDLAEKSGRMPAHKAAFFRKLLRRGATGGYVVCDPGGIPAGWSFITFSGRMSCHTDISVDIDFGGCIHDTFVAEKFRGRGLGYWLNALIVNSFGHSSAIACLVRTNNLQALKNWEKAGARQVAEIRAVRHFHGVWRHRCTLLADDETAKRLVKRLSWEK